MLNPRLYQALVATLLLSPLPITASADECFVAGDTSSSNARRPLGSRQNPYDSLAQVQADLTCSHVVVLYSTTPLDGGITLRNRQTLEGQLSRGTEKKRPMISNTTMGNGGHGVILGVDNTISNLHITNTHNSGIFGEGAELGNLSINRTTISHFSQAETIRFPFPPPVSHIPSSYAGINLVTIGVNRINIAETELRDANATAIGVIALAGDNKVVLEEVLVRDTGVAYGLPVQSGIGVIGASDSSTDLKIIDTSVINIGSGLCNCDALALLATASSTMDVRIDGYRYDNPDGDGGRSATGMEMGNFFGSGSSFTGTVRNSVIEGSTSTGIQALDLLGNSNNLVVDIRGNEVIDSRAGIQIATDTNGSTVSASVQNNLVSGASFYGIGFTNAFGMTAVVDLLVQKNTVMGSGTGLFFEQAVGGSVASLNIDAGLGGLGGQGKNRIIGSLAADIYVGTYDCCGFPPTPAFTVDAANNWWGSSAGPALVVENGGTVDYEPFLTEDPAEN
jgi:hypothetical protein